MINRSKEVNQKKSAEKSLRLWAPDKQLLDDCLMRKFIDKMFLDGKISEKNWQSVYDWSIHDLNDFWLSLSHFVHIKWQKKPSFAFMPGPTMRSGTWFGDGRLNFAENILPKPDQRVVLVAIAEGAMRREWTGLKLWNDVARCARGLKSAGVNPGDRVSGVLINSAEAIICMLATAAVGGIWSSCSPDFGSGGIKDRLMQIDPKIVFASTSYHYNGRHISNINQTLEAVSDMSPRPRVVAVDHFQRGQDEFSLFCAESFPGESEPLHLEFVERSFSDPQYIMFSSGTTGMPKCIVHSVGGTILQHKKELMLHSDLRAGDRLFFYTTCGWMMWNWMASALSVGASLVAYDGSPTYSGLSLLWDICRDENVTHFGTSPKFINVCSQDRNFNPNSNGELRALRTILATGSPLLPQHYEWVFDFFPRVHLASISGGTDIIGCFMLGNPLLPVFSGEIQSPGLGMAVECWDDSGHNVKGIKGELVCVKPFVSMPVGFWNDPTGERYAQAYFEHYPSKDVWRHGDFIEITENGGMVVYGRSDATLNPGGIRIGTSEIYRAVEKLPFIADSLAIGQEDKGDVRVILFVKINKSEVWSAKLEETIRATIRANLTPRHVPQQIVSVSDIPYTRSGKKVEMAISKIIRGESVTNKDALANPECLDEYLSLRERLKV